MIDWQRLKQREDSEHEQALVRIVVLLGVLLYCFSYSLIRHMEGNSLGFAVLGIHLLAACGIFAHIYWSPEISPVRRTAAMLLDMVLGSAVLYLMGEMVAIFFFIYLWVSTSNGLRYGANYLYAATLTSVACFAVVLSYSEFWSQHRAIGAGLILAQLFFPLHFSVLLSRLSAANSNLSRALQQTERLASTDDLTGLPNRSSLFNFLNGTIADADRNGSSFSVLFIDIDGFKEFNDKHGHAVGDELIKAIAGRIRHQIRKDDIFARIGGDEFVGILRNIEDKEAKRIAQSIVESVQKTFKIDELRLEASVSIGIATFPVDGHSSDSLLSRSDMAMYHAKRSGKNTVHAYSRAS